MSTTAGKFQVTLAIKRGDGNASVFYKHDGQRFESDNTIKMKVKTPYKFLVTFRPPQKIKLACLKGEGLEMTSEEVNSDLSRYCFQWNSHNVSVTKKNRRLYFPVILELHDMGILELPLQLKFYGSEDTGHSAWGKCLNHIDCDCIYPVGSSFVEILKQCYR